MPSGEDEFEFVLRKLLPNAAGIILNTEGAQSQIPMNTVTFEWVPTNVLDLSNLAVVVMVQDQNTKEVYQSELLIDLPAPELVTGINNLPERVFKVYPNPANDQFTVLLSDHYLNSTFKMYDNFGKLVMERTVTDNSMLIDLTGLSSGMYHIQLLTNDSIQRERLIIRHSDR